MVPVNALDEALARGFRSIAVATDGALRQLSERQSKLVTAQVSVSASVLRRLSTRDQVDVLRGVHHQLAREAAAALARQGYLGCPMYWADDGLMEEDGIALQRDEFSDSYALRRRAFVALPEGWNASWYYLRTGIPRDPMREMFYRQGTPANCCTLCPSYSREELRAASDLTTPAQLLADWVMSIDDRGERAAQNPSLPTSVLRQLLVAGVWGAWLNPTAEFELLATPGPELLEGAVWAAVDAANLPPDRLYGAGRGLQLLSYLVSQPRRARGGLALGVLRRIAVLFRLNRERG
jgi:hypothetical protein